MADSDTEKSGLETKLYEAKIIEFAIYFIVIWAVTLRVLLIVRCKLQKLSIVVISIILLSFSFEFLCYLITYIYFQKIKPEVFYDDKYDSLDEIINIVT